MKEVLIQRLYLEDRVLGDLIVFNEHGIPENRLVSLELPWMDNARCISCIPEGEYICVPYSSDKYNNVYEVTGVDDRSYILFHSGNYPRHSMGCILIGLDHQDIDGDKVEDNINSRAAMDLFRNMIGDNEFKLIIT